MALERDQLTIDIEVDANDADKNLKSLEKGLKDLQKSIDNVDIDRLSNNIENLNKNLDKTTETTKDVSVAAEVTSDSIGLMDVAIVGLSAATLVANNSLDIIGVNVRGLSNTLNHIAPLVDVLSTGLVSGFKSVRLAVVATTTAITNNFSGAINTADIAVSKFGNTSIKHFQNLRSASSAFVDSSVPGVFSFVEQLAFAAGSLGLLGAALRGADSELLNFLGNISVVAGAILGGLAFAIKIAVSTIGELISSIGVGLISSMAEFTVISEKASSITRQFEFAIKSFAAFLGNEAVGTLDFWNTKIDELTKNTLFGAEEIKKSITILAKESQILGLTAQDNALLLERAAELASANGVAIENATSAIISGLTGQSQALLSLGVDVRESSLKHSEFADKLHETNKELTDGEKTALRFSEILKQTTPIVGSAAIALDSLTGQQIKLTQEINKFKAALGEATIVEIAFIKVQRSLFEAFNAIPESIIGAIGTLQEWGGVVLVVIGTVLEYLFLLGSLQLIFTVLSGVVATNVTVQGLLTTAFATMNPLIGAQAFAVTSLTGVWLNLRAVLLSFVTNIGTSLIAVLKGIASAALAATIAISRFLIAILPLVIKVAAVVAVIFAFVKAIQELEKESIAVAGIIKTIGSAFDIFGSKADSANNELEKSSHLMGLLAESAARLMDIFINLAKIIVINIVGPLVLARKAYLELKSAFADDADVADIEGQIKNTDLALAELANSFEKAADGLVHFSDTAMAGTEELGNASAATSQLSNKLNEMNNNTKVSASELATIMSGLEEANRSLRSEIGLVGATQLQTIEKRLAFELKTLAIGRKKLAAEGKITPAISAQLDLQIQLLKQKADAVSKDIMSQAILEKGKKTEQELLVLLQDQQTIRNDLEAANNRLSQSIAAFGKGQIAQLEKKRDLEISALDAKMKQLKVEGKLTGEIEQQIQKQKELIEASSGQKIEQATSGPNVVTPDMAEGLGTVLGQGAADMATSIGAGVAAFSNPVGMMMAAADAIGGAIKSLLEFIPKMLNMVADIFNMVSDLPGKILEAIQNLFGSILRLVTEGLKNFITFLPQLFRDMIKFAFTDLPAALLSALADLPALFIEILEKDLPQIIISLIDGFIAKVPEIAIALVEGIIKATPKIAIALAKAVAITIPQAIARGLAKALSKIFKGIKIPAFNMPDITPFTKEVGKVLDKVSKGAAKVSKEVFGLIDLPEPGKGLAAVEPPDGDIIADVIEKAGKEVSGIWQSFLDALKKAWMWIWNTILKPIADFLKKAWMVIWNTFIKPIAGILKKAWMVIFNTFIKPIGSIVKLAFKFVQDIFSSLGQIVKRSFKFVKDLFNAFGNIVKKAFAAVIGFFQTYGKIVQNAFAAVIGFFQGFINIVKAAFSTVVNFFSLLFQGNISEAFQVVFDFFGQLGPMLQDMIQPLIDFFDSTVVLLVDFFQNKLLPLFNAMLEPLVLAFQFFRDVFVIYVQPFIDFLSGIATIFQDAFAPIIEFWTVTWPNFIKDTFMAVVNFFKVYFTQVLPKSIKAAFNFVVVYFRDFLPAMFKAAFKFIENYFKNVLPGIFEAAFAFIKNFFGAVLEGDIKGAFASIFTFFDDLKKPFESLLSGFKNLGAPFGKLSRAFGNILSPFRKLASALDNFKMPSIGGGGGGGIISTVTGGLFANGGLVKGPGFVETPGEFVFKKSTVDAIGPATLAGINETGKLSGSGKASATVNIQNGAIQINMLEGQSGLDVADTVIDEIRRRTLDGEFVIDSAGIRSA